MHPKLRAIAGHEARVLEGVANMRIADKPGFGHTATANSPCASSRSAQVTLYAESIDQEAELHRGKELGRELANEETSATQSCTIVRDAALYTRLAQAPNNYCST